MLLTAPFIFARGQFLILSTSRRHIGPCLAESRRYQAPALTVSRQSAFDALCSGPLCGYFDAQSDAMGLVAWRSSNALCQINKVAVHRAGLVLGWVIACGQVNHLGM